MEHPVPQNITSFEFHLVGDMTLRQFGFLATGCILAYLTFLIIFSRSPILAIILMIFFALSGALFAFIPIADRPLDHWVVAFFKAVYSPTSSCWKNPLAKKNKVEQNDPIFTNRLQNYLVSHNLEISVPKFTSPINRPTLLPQQYPATPGPKLMRMAPTIVPTPVISPIQASPQPPQPVVVQPQPVVSTLPLPPKFQPTTPIITIAQKPKMIQKSILLTSLPNVVNGIVTDFSGNYIENVIVILHNNEGIPVRASKTNKLGQFSGATPLPAGIYNVTFEKEGLNFETLQVDLNNNILPALNIQPMKGIV